MAVWQEINDLEPMSQGSCFIVFFNDFCTEMGLNYLLENAYSELGVYKMQRSIQQYTMPTYDLINYFSALKRDCINNRVIILTENKEMEIFHSLTSFKMFHLLSKKETLQFIHRVVTQSVNTNNQYASPGIIEKKEANGANKPLSQREWFVLNSLARKITPAAIGKMAGINIKTVSAHKMNAMRKLGLTSPQFLQLLVGLSEVKNISTMVLKEPPK